MAIGSLLAKFISLAKIRLTTFVRPRHTDNPSGSRRCDLIAPAPKPDRLTRASGRCRARVDGYPWNQDELGRTPLFAKERGPIGAQQQSGETRPRDAHGILQEWTTGERWRGIERGYAAEEVLRLRGIVRIEHTLARLGAERLWELLHHEAYVAALGALTGNQAMQQVRPGCKAIYLSGWQVAADANLAGQMYPDQSLYPANSVPTVVRRINQALRRADQIQHTEGGKGGALVRAYRGGRGGRLRRPVELPSS